MRAKNGAVPLTAEGISLAIARANSPEARKKYLASLRQKVRRFEREHRLPSKDLREALRSKRVRESMDIVKWFYAYEALSRLEHGGQARVERPGELPERTASGSI
jgi:hypothetical protein